MVLRGNNFVLAQLVSGKSLLLGHINGITFQTTKSNLPNLKLKIFNNKVNLVFITTKLANEIF